MSKKTGYIEVIEGNTRIMFKINGDASKSYIINEVLQALDGTVDMQYMIELLLGSKYRIVTIVDKRLPVYIVNLNLSLITFRQEFSGQLSGYYDSILDYITD